MNAPSMSFSRSRPATPTTPENSPFPALCAGSGAWLPTLPPPTRSTGTVTATASIPAICPRAPMTTPLNTSETQRILRAVQRHHHADARTRCRLRPAGRRARPRASLSLLPRPASAAPGGHVVASPGGDAERSPALVAVCPASCGDACGDLLRRAEPGVPGGGFLGALRWPRLAGSMVALIALRSLLLATLEAPEPRYTLECFPLLIVLAAVAFTRCDQPQGRLFDYAVGAGRRLIRKHRRQWVGYSECSCRWLSACLRRPR